MFDQFYKCPRTIRRHMESPVEFERSRYLAYLSQQGAAHGTLRITAEYLLVVSSYLNLPEHAHERFDLEQITEAADRWANRVPKHPSVKGVRSAKRCFVAYATGWFTFLDRIQASCTPPGPYDGRITEFADFMRQQRGLSLLTIKHRCGTVRAFFSRLCSQGISLDTLTPSDMDNALAQMVREQQCARVTVRTYANSLRAFFRYAQTQGWCAHGLADAIMAPRVFRHESLPTAPSWEQVQRLIATTKGDRPIDIRDRAILLLLSVYGLRAGEAVRLELEDIDWRKETILLRRSKRTRTASYPLCYTVGDAIVRYLREVRPSCSCRDIFLTMHAPFRPLKRSAVWGVVANRLRPIAEGLRHHGPHALRHACATHLLNEGLSLKEIGDHLGHRDPEATRIYAKVDLTRLRDVANFDLGGLL